MLPRRFQILLFTLSFVTFAWFHQGGGWNQNARFAEVRAIVEQGTFAVDDFMVYRPGTGRLMVRESVKNGEFVRDGKVHRLCWGNDPWDYNLAPVNGNSLDDGAVPVVIGWDTCTGDVGIAPDGHFHPNKPPGASLFAVPVYFVASLVERVMGLSLDDWWVLCVNGWLCSALTVGLVSALGVVLFARVAAGMFPGNQRAVLGAALVFGFGTTFFPFATLMFDHNLTAVLLLAAFADVRAERPLRAGMWAGVAAMTNYLSAVPGAMFGIWVLMRRKSWRDAGSFMLGVVPCLVALLSYNMAAFGSPFVVNTSFQNPVFKETAPAFLGMFTAPSWFAAQVITISPWRGVFVLSPALILAVFAMAKWCRRDALRAERWIVNGIALFFFTVNICFNGFHGGFAAGPRYLIPMLPFVCLALVAAFSQWPRVAFVLAAASIFQQSLLTVTDALNPLGVGAHAWRNKPGEWKEKLWGNSLVWRYAWPLFTSGRAWPVVDDKFEEWMEGQQRKLTKDVSDAAERERQLGKIRSETWARIEAGESEPLWIAAMLGPVSMNPMGMWDGTYFQKFPAHSDAAKWGAFNVGEMMWLNGRWSMLPLALMWVVGALMLRRARCA